MRKNISMVLMGMAALCACTKQVKFTPQNATLFAGDSILVSVENAGATPKLLSENTFVATVGETSGWIKARHVGETNVYCDYDANSTAAENVAKCKVTVEPRYEYYTEPVTDWMLTKEELIAKLGKPTKEMVEDGDGHVYYGDMNSDDCVIMYAFGGGRMYRAYVGHKKFTKKEIIPFLAERYTQLPLEDTNGEVIFINADTEDDATVYVQIDEGEEEPIGHLLIVVYTIANAEDMECPARKAYMYRLLNE